MVFHLEPGERPQLVININPRRAKYLHLEVLNISSSKFYRIYLVFIASGLNSHYSSFMEVGKTKPA